MALILGVERKTIEAWENGGKPSKPASRIMQMLKTKEELLDLLITQNKAAKG